MGELFVLLLPISPRSISKKEGRDLRIMFRRILIAGWVFIFGSALLLALFPVLATRIPHLEYVRPLMIALALATIVYGISWLYHRGMNHATKN